MTIFKLRPDVESYEWLTFPRDEDFGISQQFRGSSVRNEWKTPSVSSIHDDLSSGALPGDFPSLGGIPVFSERALSTLEDILTANGEVLPFRSTEGSYYAYNVLTVIDALDENRSKIERFTDGLVMDISEYVFWPDLVHGLTIFKIPQLLSHVFVTDTFVARVKQAGLVGFKFKEVWSDIETIWASET